MPAEGYMNSTAYEFAKAAVAQGIFFTIGVMISTAAVVIAYLVVMTIRRDFQDRAYRKKHNRREE